VNCTYLCNLISAVHYIYQALEHRGLVHEFTGRDYQDVIGDPRARFYQSRVDARLESLIGIVKKYNGIESRGDSSERP